MSLWLREETKAQPPGLTSYGWGGGPLFSDAFRSRRAPSLPALAEAYKSLIFTCVRMNADAVTRVPLRLFRAGQSKGDTAKCEARRATRAERFRLKRLSYTTKAMAGAEEVEEIVGDHPLLKVIQDGNPAMDRDQLINYTVMSMDVVGTAFWWPDEFTLGTPQEFWPLPPHLVTPLMSGQGLVPEAYQFGTIQYRPEDLLIFKHLSMKNPYALGMSPTQAAIEYARLEDTFVSIQDDLLSNGPRPSVVVSHKDPKGAFGESERKRLENDMNAKGRGGKSGGAFVVDGAVAVTPISWSPADLGAVEISKYDLERTCGCFGVPVSMVTNESSNMAVAREGLEQHARNAIEPRCKNIASTLTRWTHALDKNGKRNWSKLFWAFDDCVPGDQAAEAAKHTAYVAMGLPPNVALTEAGYDKVEGGDVSFVASGLQTIENAVKPPEPPVLPGQKPGEDPEDPDDKPPGKPKDDESKALDAEIAEVLDDVRTKLAMLPDAKGLASDWVWDAELKRYVPCRDENGRFASCDGGATGAKPKKPGKKPAKPAKKPKEPKPAAPKKPKEPAKPKEPKKPATPKPPKEKPAPAPKPAKEPKKPAEPKPPKEAKPKPEKPAPKEKPKPAEKPATNYREFRESHDAIQQMTKWGKGQSKGWHDSLSPTEAAAVKEYGTNTYGVLNGLLRGKTFSEIKREASYFIPAGMTAARAKTLLKDTKAAFGKATISEPVVLFRGIKERGGLVPDLDALKPGSIITEKGFVSTSLDRGIASEFAGPSQIFKSNLVMRIKAPAGTKGAYIDAGGLATFKEAQEVTLAAGTKYRYVGRSKMPGVAGDVDVMEVEIIP